MYIFIVPSEKKNDHSTHIYWVCSRFVILQLSKMGV